MEIQPTNAELLQEIRKLQHQAEKTQQLAETIIQALAAIALPRPLTPEACFDLLSEVFKVQDGQPWTVADLAAWTREYPLLEKVATEAARGEIGGILESRLQRLLPNQVNKNFDGLMLEARGKVSRANAYFVVPCQASPALTSEKSSTRR